MAAVLCDWPEVGSFLVTLRDTMFDGMRSDLRAGRIDPFDPALRRYLIASMGSLPDERLRVLFLDTAHGLIADEQMQHGTLCHLAIYPRTIFRRALEHNAAAIILVHNHPGGDATPSEDDIEATRKLDQIGRALDVEVLDHIIVTPTRLHHIICERRSAARRANPASFTLRSEVLPEDEAIDRACRNAETVLRRRILRRQLVGSAELFGEPAWDMLIDLFIHECKGQQLSMSSLCATAGIPTSSAMKLAQRLCEAGILERTPDLFDGRRTLMKIAPEVGHRLRAYFAEGTE
ncbi:DNA repair protein RadC [Sphingobium herbicidovorans NBRC 16415]|uniref:DNA repair protein RadC n=1 Tax=Sphingobium herbicidovorans (strain ATCC 700291 / DSM 11019 / CCUG 56400 / KCTC 2939 / LMG 18315 / NBRC 16415 / MH) TaxID=1219045 RepID=A0A086P7S8_SPHHM|nr:MULTISPECIES: JAB domain-containing protein [Sphingomonadaceae]KFG89446.1 DNA repair protein RadC [Sphingobium herbicidovorans NBRC 16415]